MRKIHLALLVVSGLVIALPIGWLRARGGGDILVRWWMCRVARVLGLDIVVHGVPVPGPTLWCANHISWLDVIALGTLGNAICLQGRGAGVAGDRLVREGRGHGIPASGFGVGC